MIHLLVDISNSFTKVALGRRDVGAPSGGSIGNVWRIPTPELTVARLREATTHLEDSFEGVAVSSVVPARTQAVREAFDLPCLEVGPGLDLGIGIGYPCPEEIGADRLANTVACFHLVGAPAIVVDFGTAVTFDVLSEAGDYLGGVIAPGLPAMTDYLHEKTALLPRVELAEPPRAVGQSTREAMLAGAVFGYRGLIREIVSQIRREAFGGSRCLLVATGGHAELIGAGLPLFDRIDPLLTLRGLLVIAGRNPCPHPG